MKFFFTIILMTALISLCPAMAQGDSEITHDPGNLEDSVTLAIVRDSALFEKKSNKEIKLTEKSSDFKPNPTKAVIYSAIFPGLGQIYNRKYWKLPLVYGGFLGCTYAITWNTAQYDDYKKAYSDISVYLEGDKTADSWLDYLRYGTNVENLTTGDLQWYKNAFKNKKDFYRRNRDLSYIVTIGVYFLCMLDAYVDAQLFDFDISPDLSLRVEPVIYNKAEFNTTSLGLQCSIKF